MVWVLTITLGLILVLVMVILFAPMTFVVDTYKHEYSVKVLGLVKLQPIWNEEGFRVSLQMPFYKFEINPSNQRKKEKAAKKKKERTGTTIKFHPRKIAALLDTFEVRKFYLTLDTDNYVLNAQLYPAFALLTHRGLAASINFNSETQLQLTVSNNLCRLILAYIL